jgi:hypothetical protein
LTAAAVKQRRLPSVTKATIKLLEKVFAAEVAGHLFQSKSKQMKALEEDQYVEMVQDTLGKDRFGPIIVEGWALTHRGRITYCEWAKNQPTANE